MNDVAVAEGDADKGEIVISPATHALLHNFTSLQSATHSVRATPRGGAQGGGGGDHSMDDIDIMGSAGGTGCAMPDSPHKRDRADSRSLPDSHPLACGCTVTPSGYFKINTGMEDSLCVVDFAGAAAASNSSSNAAMLNLNTGGYEGSEVNVDLQYEFEVYAQVVDELLSGYKIVSPLLQVQFSDQLKHLALIPVEGETSCLAHIAPCLSHSHSSITFFSIAQRQKASRQTMNHPCLDDPAKPARARRSTTPRKR